ncbi:SPOR domain-containing protein [Sphingomonas sp. GlSt437]|uniref:SPOR domain-containing protein n=1 Tax=Sphingomonas sp. GlSt437 TaxID=3389970 RepID=UPI003A889B3A
MATSGEFELGDEDRLPWLETVDEDYSAGPSVFRTVLFVLLSLAVVGAIVYGVYWYQQHHAKPGSGELIQAQEGDYKVRPDDPGGMKVEGQGDTAFATSEGKTDGNAQIDMKAMPEAPVVAPKSAAPTATPSAKPADTAKPKDQPKPAVTPASGGKGAVVQLGSFPSEAEANKAWAAQAKRFAYLAPLGKSVEPAIVGGRTVFRLRVNAGSAGAASDLCDKLKVAGEACFIP